MWLAHSHIHTSNSNRPNFWNTSKIICTSEWFKDKIISSALHVLCGAVMHANPITEENFPKNRDGYKDWCKLHLSKFMFHFLFPTLFYFFCFIRLVILAGLANASSKEHQHTIFPMNSFRVFSSFVSVATAAATKLFPNQIWMPLETTFEMYFQNHKLCATHI